MTDTSIPTLREGDLVILLGRVAAVPVEGGLVPVETSTGGFVWLDPRECEQIPAAEVACGLEQ